MHWFFLPESPQNAQILVETVEPAAALPIDGCPFHVYGPLHLGGGWNFDLCWRLVM